MKVADVARQFNVTEQAVRNRIQRAGYSLEKLRKDNSFDFTEEGQKIVLELMEKKPKERQTWKKAEPQERQTTITALRSELAAARTAAATAEATAAAQKETIAILQAELKDLKALLVAQQARALPEPAPAQDPGTGNRRGLFSWFRRKKV